MDQMPIPGKLSDSPPPRCTWLRLYLSSLFRYRNLDNFELKRELQTLA